MCSTLIDQKYHLSSFFSRARDIFGQDFYLCVRKCERKSFYYCFVRNRIYFCILYKNNIKKELKRDWTERILNKRNTDKNIIKIHFVSLVKLSRGRCSYTFFFALEFHTAV